MWRIQVQPFQWYDWRPNSPQNFSVGNMTWPRPCQGQCLVCKLWHQWPRPFQRQFVIRRLVLATINMHTKFEVSSLSHSRDISGGTKKFKVKFKMSYVVASEYEYVYTNTAAIDKTQTISYSYEAISSRFRDIIAYFPKIKRSHDSDHAPCRPWAVTCCYQHAHSNIRKLPVTTAAHPHIGILSPGL